LIRKALLSGTLLLAATSSDIQAQAVELAPFFGWQFGGGFNNAGDPANSAVNGLDIKNNWVYGLVLDVGIGRGIWLEFLADRENTELTSQVGGTPLFVSDIAVDYYHAGAIYQWTATGLKKPLGFFGLTAGATNFIPSDDRDSTLKFSFGVVLGVRSYFSERFGVRLESRFMATYINETTGLFCSDTGFCYQIPAGTIMRQLNVVGGVIVRL
jgi:hypothetical protein